MESSKIPKPQLTFKEKIDNSNAVFVPILKEKPNAIKPLTITLERDGKKGYCHPYEWEIEKFQPEEEVLQSVGPLIPKPFDETPLEIVKTEKQLKELCKHLKGEKAFAVDLEHHSLRSFLGFTCLMQISTRDRDYIIDVIDLRSDMFILNEVFTDPKIVKVLHGADMDVLWLQKDFGLYIVNLFDTGQAARVLDFPHLSLSYLLLHYCNLDLDKSLQLADWRVRPLTSEMLNYARGDTHYLLYVYDCLKNDLIEASNDTKNLLTSTFDRSKVICAKTYEKPTNSAQKLYKKSKKTLNEKQLYCLKELYTWRDNIARENDESTNYVLPSYMMIRIAEVLPKEKQGILACLCNKSVPPLVEQHLNDLHSIIIKTHESFIKTHESFIKQETKKRRNEGDAVMFPPSKKTIPVVKEADIPSISREKNKLPQLHWSEAVPDVEINQSEDEKKRGKWKKKKNR